MNIFEKIKALWTVKSAAEKIQEAYKMDTTSIKPGYRTTEFWLSVIASIVTVLGALKGIIPANVATIALTVLTTVYGIVRTIAKSNAPDLPSVDTTTTTIINK